MSRVELDAESLVRAGCIRLSYCRNRSGPLVGIYRNAESGMESDPETPYSVVCEEHNTLVSVETLRIAGNTATDTCNFCDDCREAQEHNNCTK